jgi:hypothetical protein
MRLTIANWNCAHRNATSAIPMLDRFSPAVIALQECCNAQAAPGDVRSVTENKQQHA